MRGEARIFVHFLDGSDKRFVIPVYQRNYNWKIANCRQLFDDLVRLHRQERESHFFGSIVSSGLTGGKPSELLIIDGQQRITTISLLFAAMVNILKKGVLTAAPPKLCRKIEHKFLVDECQTDQRKIRLKPVKNDREAFDRLIAGVETDFLTQSNITQNYYYFYRRIVEEQELTLDELYQATSRLTMIDIFLDESDSPQLIFESLNSTGLDLEESDKIRNYILMGLDTRLQEKYYEAYWNKIEEQTDFRVSSFVRDYLTMQQGKSPVLRQVYFTFKEYMEQKQLETEEILRDLLENASYYHRIIHASTGDKQIDSLLIRLRQLDLTTHYPFLLALFRYAAEVALPPDELVDILSTLESYVFRRLICELPASGLNKTFATLHADVLRLKRKPDSYSEVLKYLLTSKTASGAFPSDEEFLAAAFTRNIYTLSARNKAYLFDRLENGASAERVNVVEKLEDGTFSIEHIMPRTLTPLWKESLGTDYQRIHLEWLHTLPNLTVTGYNSKYSNRTFLEKRDMPDGFYDSGLRMNRKIASYGQWTEKEMKQRRGELATQLLSLWAWPVTTFTSASRETITFRLEDDIDLTGMKITGFSYATRPYLVTNWKELYRSVIKLVYQTEPVALIRMANNPEFPDICSEHKAGMEEVIEGIYLNTSASVKSKLKMLRLLFEECGLEKDLLEIQVVPSSL